MVKTLGEKVAVLEEQNAEAKPLHEQFRLDIAELKGGQARIETTLALLVTNGHTSKFRTAFPYASAITFLGGLTAVLTFLG